jgi:hypothetical protein
MKHEMKIFYGNGQVKVVVIENEETFEKIASFLRAENRKSDLWLENSSDIRLFWVNLGHVMQIEIT